jgi:hypothetical protein
MERLGLSRCVISGAIFFLAIGSVGCDDRSSPEIVEPGDAAKKAGIEGYSNVVVKDSAAVVKATIHHANEAFDGARLTSVRNRESGKWNLRLEAPSGTTDVDWRPRSGQVTVTGSKGRKTVKARSSYKSRTQYEATGKSKTRAYQREIELAALAHDDLTMPEETPVGVEPPQTYEPNYISPDSARALEELTSEKSSMKRSSPSDGSPHSSRFAFWQEAQESELHFGRSKNGFMRRTLRQQYLGWRLKRSSIL